MSKYKAMIAGIAVLAVPALSPAAVISMDADDGIGASSFNTGVNWVGDAAPSAGNDYVTGNYTLRTPANGSSYTFAGDSLTVNNNSAYSKGLLYKGTGSTGNITIDNLILNQGLISHASGTADVFNLYGTINVAGNSTLYPKQGAIRIYSDISGTAQLTIQASDAGSGNKIWIHSANNTFTGNIVNNGRLETADNSVLMFDIGANGINNNISNGGAGTQQHSMFGGDFLFDLTDASTTIGDSWTIVNTVAASTYWLSTFSVVGFTDQGSGVWTGTANGAEYEFRTGAGTGTLTVIPEPATIGMFGVVGAIMLFIRRRFFCR
jgi:hypothetical protein